MPQRNRKSKAAAADLPVYADMPNLLTLEATRAILQAAGVVSCSDFSLNAHAKKLKSVVRTAVAISDGRLTAGVKRHYKQVSRSAIELRGLLEDRVIVGVPSVLGLHPHSAEAIEADRILQQLPQGLDVLTRVASGIANLPGERGRPSQDVMRCISLR